MKTLLVTTDFSTSADRAIASAGDLAAALQAKLIVLHVMGAERPPVADPDRPHFNVAKALFEADSEREEEARTSLAERAQALPEGVEVECVIKRGATVNGIVATAEEHSADMIVISSLGRTGLSRLLLGSVAEELTRVAQIPVLVWKPKGG